MQPYFALIGCGRIAKKHAENIAKIGVLSAVCDILPQRADEFALQFNARPYYSLKHLLAAEQHLTVAVICTPNGLHAAHSIQSLEKGLHVLCEKPLCIFSKDGKAMIEAGKKHGKNLFVVKQNRFNPPLIKLKKLLDENRLGNITNFQLNCFWNRPKEYYNDTWRGTKKLDGGTLYTQFSHFIDLLYWTLGDVREVNAVTKNFSHPYIEFEDTGAVIFQMTSGAIGTLNYTVNSFEKNMEGSFTVFGDKGTVKIGGQYLNNLEYQAIENYMIENLPSSTGANNYGFYQGSMSNHHKVYENFLNALQNNEHKMTGAEDGLKTVEIIEKIYQSANQALFK